MRVTSVAASAPLWAAAEIVSAGSFDVVVVVDVDGNALGFVLADSVTRVAARFSTAPIGMLGLEMLGAPLTTLLSVGGELDDSGALVAKIE